MRCRCSVLSSSHRSAAALIECPVDREIVHRLGAEVMVDDVEGDRVERRSGLLIRQHRDPELYVGNHGDLRQIPWKSTGMGKHLLSPVVPRPHAKRVSVEYRAMVRK